MKVLFFPVYVSTPHFETELELMLKHINAGDKVSVLKCDEDLFSCEINPEHKKSICYKCKSRFNKGTSIIKGVEVLKYPKLRINYDILKQDFTSIEELKNYSIEGIGIGMGVASTLIDRYNKDHKLDTIKFSKEIYIELKSAYLIYKVFENTIIENRPNLVYIFNGRFSTLLPMVLCCEKHNIDYYTHERTGGQLNKYSLFYNSVPHLFGYAKLEIEECWKSNPLNRKKLGASYFIERRNRVIQSWHSFTENQQHDLLPSDIPKHKTIISIFNSTIGEYTAIRGRDNPFSFFLNEYDCLSKIFDFYKNYTSLQFYLRIHPNLTGADNTQIKQLKTFIGKYNNVEIILPESPIDTYSLVDSSDKIIVLGSTIGVEACYWGKPVIALASALYRDIDTCYWPKTFEEFDQMIKSELSPKNKIGALKYGNWELTRGYDFKYFRLESLFRGKFLDKNISLNNIQKIIYYSLRIIEIKNIRELLKMAQRKLKI
jgi:hypothetical protein